jgi:hypothetical protein
LDIARRPFGFIGYLTGQLPTCGIDIIATSLTHSDDMTIRK